MAIVRAGDWIVVNTTKHNSPKVKLKGEKFEVLRTNVATGELVIDTGEMMGQVKLLFTEVGQTVPPKVSKPQKSSSTLESTLAGIKNLISRYRESGGKTDTYFLEQILGRESLEQILSNLYMSAKTSICSEKPEDSICSEKPEGTGANTIENLPRNKGGKPPGRRNNKPASGWLDKYESKKSGAATWYFCRPEYKRCVKKTKILNGQKATVEQMIKSGYSASQIEELIGEAVIF
ncbi:MAG: hypothetical protein AB4080_01930 [Trichodesmium sp.]